MINKGSNDLWWVWGFYLKALAEVSGDITIVTVQGAELEIESLVRYQQEKLPAHLLQEIVDDRLRGVRR